MNHLPGKINIIKFGGSIISDQFSETHYNRRNTLRLAKEFYPFYKGSILIHGTGYIGKAPAIKYGYVQKGIISKEDSLVALTIKSRIRQLNLDVIDTLISASIPAIPIDILHFYNDPEELFNLRELKRTILDLLKNNYVPVFYGDLLPRPDGSYKVISSDLLTFLLSKAFKPENVIFLSNVDGIYPGKAETENDSHKVVIKKLTKDKMASIGWFDNDDDDVSGGMRKKAELALKISAFSKKCFIGSGYADNILSNVLNGHEVVGTFVYLSDKISGSELS
jgi:isopentenyl phosphate kinase